MELIQKRLKVLFSPESRVNIILAGCGGTGSFLAWNIARIMLHEKEAGREMAVTFIDPDIVEERNIGRQHFGKADIGKQKAASLAVRYNKAFGLDIGHFFGKVSQNDFELRYDKESDLLVVVGAVDNRAARVQIRNVIDRFHNKLNAWWIDCGNEEFFGQVLVGNAAKNIKKHFKTESLMGYCSRVPLPHVQHPELIDTKKDVAEKSCAARVMENTQSLMVNQSIAAIASQYLYKMVIKKEIDSYATYMNLDDVAVSSKYITESLWDEYTISKKCPKTKKAASDTINNDTAYQVHDKIAA